RRRSVSPVLSLPLAGRDDAAFGGGGVGGCTRHSNRTPSVARRPPSPSRGWMKTSPQVLRLDVLGALGQRDQQPVLAEDRLAGPARVRNPAQDHVPHQRIP